MDKCTGAAALITTAAAEIVEVAGEIDRECAAALRAVLDRALALSRPITVDLTRCRYIGSFGLRALLYARRSAVAPFTTVATAGGIVARLLHIANVEEQLGVRYVAGGEEAAIPDEETAVRVITIAGEWDLSRGNELRAHIDAALTHPRVVIDLSDVTYFDSHCFAMFVGMRSQRVAKGYEPARLVAPSGNLRRVLAVLGADRLWSVHDSLVQALGDWQHCDNISAAVPT